MPYEPTTVEQMTAFLQKELVKAKRRLRVYNSVRMLLEEWDGKSCNIRLGKALEEALGESFKVYYTNDKTSYYIHLTVRERGNNPEVDEHITIVDKQDNKDCKVNFAKYEANHDQSTFICGRIGEVEATLREPAKIVSFLESVANYRRYSETFIELITKQVDPNRVLRGGLNKREGNFLHEVGMALY